MVYNHGKKKKKGNAWHLCQHPFLCDCLSSAAVVGVHPLVSIGMLMEMQLCFHVEFRPCWSLSDCTHWARNSTLLEKIHGVMIQRSEALDPTVFQGKEGRGKLVSLG